MSAAHRAPAPQKGRTTERLSVLHLHTCTYTPNIVGSDIYAARTHTPYTYELMDTRSASFRLIFKTPNGPYTPDLVSPRHLPSFHSRILHPRTIRHRFCVFCAKILSLEEDRSHFIVSNTPNIDISRPVRIAGCQITCIKPCFQSQRPHHRKHDVPTPHQAHESAGYWLQQHLSVRFGCSCEYHRLRHDFDTCVCDARNIHRLR